MTQKNRKPKSGKGFFYFKFKKRKYKYSALFCIIQEAYNYLRFGSGVKWYPIKVYMFSLCFVFFFLRFVGFNMSSSIRSRCNNKNKQQKRSTFCQGHSTLTCVSDNWSLLTVYSVAYHTILLRGLSSELCHEYPRQNCIHSASRRWHIMRENVDVNEWNHNRILHFNWLQKVSKSETVRRDSRSNRTQKNPWLSKWIPNADENPCII